MKSEEIKKVLENHKHWINEDVDGWANMRADLYGADMRRADLYVADLRGADLCRADLRGADLRGADLRGANLCEANLYGANLHGSNLCGVNLYGTNLCRANLRGADLREANLHRAILCRADLCRANLRGADLRGADLWRADLCGAKNVPFVPYACPDFGIFIGFKKASGYIVVLEIPEDAKRLSATSRKCRCNKAKVLEIQNIDGTKADVTEVKSGHDSSFVYRVGDMVSVPDFDENRWNECSTGIHFFINRQEAVNY